MKANDSGNHNREKAKAQEETSNSEFENFQRMLKQVLSVPKETVDGKLAERKRKKRAE